MATWQYGNPNARTLYRNEGTTTCGLRVLRALVLRLLVRSTTAAVIGWLAGYE